MPSDAEERAHNELAAWTLGLRDREFIHQYVVDAWTAQHAGENTRPMPVAFALLGLYLHLEQGFSGRAVQRAHMQLAQPSGRGPGRRVWPRFALPSDRGCLTACDVMAASEQERPEAIDRWCRSVWSAWVHSHAAVAALAQELSKR